MLIQLWIVFIKVEEQKHSQTWQRQFEWEALVLIEPKFAFDPKTSNTRPIEAAMHASEIARLDQLE